VIEGFWTTEFYTLESLQRFIRNCESHIRTSLEYRKWVASTYGVQKICAVCGVSPYEATIEVHHHPFTLFDLVEVALSKMKRLNTLVVSTLVLGWHFRGIVGWVPLCKTHHESVHNLITHLHPSVIQGQWQVLIEKYSPPEDVLTRVYTRIERGYTGC